MNPILTRIRNAALTYPQVMAPRLAGAAVRTITSGGSKGKSKGGAAKVHRGTGLSVGQPGTRYAPERPANGRTDGILAAQAAAAPVAPEAPADSKIVDIED